MKPSRLHRLIAACCGIALTGGVLSLLARAGIIHPIAFWLCIMPLTVAALRIGAALMDALDEERDKTGRF
jgi:hypothetical protein